MCLMQNIYRLRNLQPGRGQVPCMRSNVMRSNRLRTRLLQDMPML